MAPAIRLITSVSAAPSSGPSGKVPNNRYSQLSRITEKSILMPLCQCPLCPPLPEGFHYGNNGDIEDRRDSEGFKGL